MTLPAFPAVARGCGAVAAGCPLSIDIFFPYSARQQTCRTPLLRWNDGTD